MVVGNLKTMWFIYFVTEVTSSKLELGFRDHKSSTAIKIKVFSEIRVLDLQSRNSPQEKIEFSVFSKNENFISGRK